ncbi:MAG TPA: hypothetical protein VG603_04875, partial [Chitinophagales bacterium]|nr:hypothetical protein [Chitinophagales bacterium]
SSELLNKFEHLYKRATTVTACGFYGPQGRRLRASNTFEDFIGVISSFRHKHFRVTNLEMETSGIYGFGKILGHHCLSINAVLADRQRNTFSTNPGKVVKKMIEQSLEVITQ